MLNRSYIEKHEGHPHYFTDAEITSFQKVVDFSSDEEMLLRMMKNLADPTKFKIYRLLHQVREMSVSDISQVLSLSQSAVSHALSDFHNLGIVEMRRCGQLMCYALSSGKPINKILHFLHKL